MKHDIIHLQTSFQRVFDISRQITICTILATTLLHSEYIFLSFKGNFTFGITRHESEVLYGIYQLPYLQIHSQCLLMRKSIHFVSHDPNS